MSLFKVVTAGSALTVTIKKESGEGSKESGRKFGGE